MCTDMLKRANIEGEDEQEETIQDMEGLFCCWKNCAPLYMCRVETKNRLKFRQKLASCSPCYESREIH